MKAEKPNDLLKRKMKLNEVHGVKHQNVKRSQEKHLKERLNRSHQLQVNSNNAKKKRKESISVRGL